MDVRNMGLPCRGGRIHPLAEDPNCWHHWQGPDPWAALTRYRAQDATRAADWRVAVRDFAEQLPGPAEALVLKCVGIEQ